jgi:hypothetical protein
MTFSSDGKKVLSDIESEYEHIFYDYLKENILGYKSEYLGLRDDAPQEAKDAYKKWLKEKEKEAEEWRKFDEENERREARGELPLLREY